MINIMNADRLNIYTEDGTYYIIKYNIDTDATGNYDEHFHHSTNGFGISGIKFVGNVSMRLVDNETVVYISESVEFDDYESKYDGRQVFFVHHEWDFYIGSSEEAIRDAIADDCSAECAGK